MGKLLVLVAAGAGFILAAASNAAELVSPPAAPATPPPAAPPPDAAPPPAAAIAGRAAQVAPTGRPIVLEAGKGTLIRLPRPASTVFIANPDVADVQVKSPSLIYVNAKATGETVLYAVDAEDRVLLNAPVRVEHDLSRLRESLRYMVPGENISLNSVDGSLVLSGNVSNAGQAERVRALAAAIAAETKGNVVNQLRVVTPNQVNIRVKIAEVNRSVLKALGFNWTKATGTFQFTTGNPVSGGQISAQNLLSYGIPLPGNMARLEVTLDALAQENLLTTLAEPNLTTVSGQPASFLAGGQFFIPVPQATGTGSAPTITLQSQTFGVQLAVTPTIIDANHLSLRIRPEVSELSATGAVTVSGFNIPGLSVRRAETTVELGSGQSFALAGLLQNTTQQNVSKIPGLGDIPIIGQLFRSDQFQRNETELVIIVTPYLVQPTSTALAAPTNGFVPPHDAQRVMTSATYRQGLPAPTPAPVGPGGRGLIGPVGFRLD
jgi:pilus assembly protein CpaC